MGEPWFTAIRQGRKVIEGRLHKGKFADLRPGSVLIISKSTTVPTRSKPVPAVVTRVVRYKTFEEYS